MYLRFGTRWASMRNWTWRKMSIRAVRDDLHGRFAVRIRILFWGGVHDLHERFAMRVWILFWGEVHDLHDQRAVHAARSVRMHQGDLRNRWELYHCGTTEWHILRTRKEMQRRNLQPVFNQFRLRNACLFHVSLLRSAYQSGQLWLSAVRLLDSVWHRQSLRVHGWCVRGAALLRELGTVHQGWLHRSLHAGQMRVRTAELHIGFGLHTTRTIHVHQGNMRGRREL